METKSYSARDALRTAHFVEFVYDADIERIYMDECKQPWKRRVNHLEVSARSLRITHTFT